MFKVRWLAVLDEMLLALWTQFIGVLPGIVAAAITLLIGLILGKVCGWLAREVVKRSTVEKYIAKSKHLNLQISTLFDIIVRWLIYLVFIQQASIFLGVVAITQFVNGILAFIPGIIGATIIIIVGYVIALYLKENIIGSKDVYSRLTGHIVFLLVIYLSIATGLKSISGLNTTLLDYVLLAILVSVGLGFAIAIGLGLKDVVREIAKDFVKKKK